MVNCIVAANVCHHSTHVGVLTKLRWKLCVDTRAPGKQWTAAALSWEGSESPQTIESLITRVEACDDWGGGWQRNIGHGTSLGSIF